MPPDPVPTPRISEYFDHPAAAAAAGLEPKQLAAIVHLFEADYPTDLMLRELHILRACNAIRDGRTRIESLLRAEPPASAA